MRNILLFTFILFSCSTSVFKKAPFKVINNSDYSVDEILIYTSDSLATFVMKDLRSNESKEGFLDMTDCKRQDGEYLISFTSNSGEKMIGNNGYYSNGAPSQNQQVVFTITNDSIASSIESLY